MALGAASEQNGTDFLLNLQQIIQTPSLMSTVGCENPKGTDFEILFYTREKPLDPTALNINDPELDPTKPIIFLIHGWMQSPKVMVDVKKAYLYRYDSNVIMINWETLAWDYYSAAACKVPKMAKLIAKFLCGLNEKYGIDLGMVHFVGHSLGAHISGIIGQNTQNMCEWKIGRITGLDPSGPLFVDTPRSERLDSSDAHFVDVVHSNGGLLGYLGNCGHADFYLNCGTIQPGCTLPDYSLKSFINIPLAIGMCNHMRSIEVWAESVETDNFKAAPCYYCPIGCPPVLSIFRKKITMGEKCPHSANGGYFVKTDFKKPYAIKFLI